MTKKGVVKAAAVLAAAILTVPAFAGHKPKACTDSVLCLGLVEHYDFEEGSDSLRLGSAAFGTFEEPGGQDIGNAVGKFGNAVVFTGTSTSYLTVSPSGNFGSMSYTIGVWLYPTSAGSAGQKQAIISTDAPNSRGETLYVENVSGNLQARWQVTLTDDSQLTISSTTNISLSAWHRLVAQVDFTNYDPGAGASNGARLKLYVDGAATTPVTIALPIKGGMSEIGLGGRPYAGGEWSYTGRLDSLDVWMRPVLPSEVSLDYNSGSGRAFPFSTP